MRFLCRLARAKDAPFLLSNDTYVSVQDFSEPVAKRVVHHTALSCTVEQSDLRTRAFPPATDRSRQLCAASRDTILVVSPLLVRGAAGWTTW